MSFSLGIDTGGTFTDGAVVDLVTGRVRAKAKAITTRHDLAIGIENCIRQLPAELLPKIKLVALSTTLATNAIVEGQGCEVGIILIGSRVFNKLPTQHVVMIKGGHDIKGNPREALDLAEAVDAIEQLKPKVDAYAVSGYSSVRNPEHELTLKRLVHERTDHQVVCGHELTRTLGFYERTVTAALNARLLPIISNLFQSMKRVMLKKGIDIPLMMVKGDGSLVGEAVARDRPIETLMSGPAASIMGAQYLAHFDNAIVADMGGTTTDIAVITNGKPSYNGEGALVGGWLTRVHAANILTVGLGGDSHIRVTRERKITVGPQRVFPLAWATHQYPHLLHELYEIAETKYYPLFSQSPDIFTFIKDPLHVTLSPLEEEVLNTIRSEPHTLFELGKILKKDPNIIPWERLIDFGLVHRASLTPTDLLHYKGEMTLWNREGSLQGMIIQANRAGLSPEEFCIKVENQLSEKVATAILEKVFSEETGTNIRFDDCANCQRILAKLFNRDLRDIVHLLPEMKHPLIAIGAPAQAYFPLIAKKIGARLIIPEHAEVANAVGAATGKIAEKLELLVQPAPSGGYLAYTPWGREWFRGLEEALNQSIEKGKVYVAHQAEESGIGECMIEVEHKDKYSSLSNVDDDENNKLYVESRIKLTAVGKPRWS
jgi:N-methylhydantoinase A/oxoprolinase/acetone carboxylase beta subunit